MKTQFIVKKKKQIKILVHKNMLSQERVDQNNNVLKTVYY